MRARQSTRLVPGVVLMMLISPVSNMAAAQNANPPAAGSPAASKPDAAQTALQKVKLPSAISGFVQASGAITSSATSELQLYRTEYRLQHIRQALIPEITNAADGKTLDLTSLNPTALLCDIQGDYNFEKSYQVYLDAVTAKIDSTSTGQVSSVSTAIISLFNNYTFSVSAPQSLTDPDKFKAKFATSCRTDITGDKDKNTPGYYNLYYGGRPEAALAAFAAISALWDAFNTVVGPALTAGGKAIDDARRLKAIRTYLDVKANQNNIKATSAHLANLIVIWQRYKKATAIGQFIEGVTSLRTTPLDLGKIQECHDYLSIAGADRLTLTNGIPPEQFIRCNSAVWDKVKGTVTSTLKAASDYDALADTNAEAATAAQAKIVKYLANIDVDDPAKLSEIWSGVIQLLTIGQGIFNQKNDDALNKAIKGLVTAF
jgi:hypothetical protein